jgi:hypothetical protein
MESCYQSVRLLFKLESSVPAHNVCAHPTLSEALMWAAHDAEGHAIQV